MATTQQTMSTSDAVLLIERLMIAAFNRSRDPRSDAYILGVREVLKCKTMGVRFYCAYKSGTAEADAFLAGADEGDSLWRNHLDSGA